MGKSPVGLCHLMCIFAFLNRGSLSLEASASSSASFSAIDLPYLALAECNQPGHRQGQGPSRRDFHRDLVGSAADAARFNLELRSDVFYSLFQDA